LGHGEGAGADMLKFIVGLMIGMTLGLYLATYGRELAEVLGLSALVTLL
jgi:hypothetical protein